ncbi:hypothetical protein IV203_036173 [Nitzschia inconspicua]|uniref:Uncharacterized protein n=1 Tax=Nitzschia inconspicua TaxID=303405 RepID=A0A9K3LFI0_9STRA|nr:hypothetical protein IV203_036173 [Nitzschia inconspicua]
MHRSVATNQVVCKNYMVMVVETKQKTQLMTTGKGNNKMDTLIQYLPLALMFLEDCPTREEDSFNNKEDDKLLTDEEKEGDNFQLRNDKEKEDLWCKRRFPSSPGGKHMKNIPKIVGKL